MRGSFFSFFKTQAMTPSKTTILTGNQAVAQIAYKINDACVIYPITPASEMSELSEKWSAQEKQNIFGNIPSVVEMQSEAGVAGTMHGSLQAGTSTTTFTASQGLLLMMPNMFRIAGELNPNVIHVATRSVATHALSVFGDHSDIMAVRSTGYAFLGASSVQEAMDFALIAQAASFASSIPFVHFFDGFRTSHESATVLPISDEHIKDMIDQNDLNHFRHKRLTPDNPFIRGTSQGPDVFFQSREAVNLHYQNCADIVAKKMIQFGKLTARNYQPFEYVGHPQAQQVVIAMGSACETLEQTVKFLNGRGQKTGLIKVKLFRPFSCTHLLSVLPESCRRIAVLDRTKEPGSSAEPLCLDVLKAIEKSNLDKVHKPAVFGGRYGLGSKEFTPAMAVSVFSELQQDKPRDGFTVGIEDDLTNLSLAYNCETPLIDNGFEIIISAQKGEVNSASFENLLEKLNGKDELYLQGYSECSYKKSKGNQLSHIRLSAEPIHAPYLVQEADLMICDGLSSLRKDKLLKRIKTNGRLLFMNECKSSALFDEINEEENEMIRQKNISVGFLQILPEEVMDSALRQLINNLDLHGSQLQFSEWYEKRIDPMGHRTGKQHHPSITDPEPGNGFIEQLLAGNGNSMPVSMFPVDGSYPTNTAKLRQSSYTSYIPEWDLDACTQCGACTLACPLAAIRAKAFDKKMLENAPVGFPNTNCEILGELKDDLAYSVQVNPDQCDGCNHCIEACPEEALTMKIAGNDVVKSMLNWNFFEDIRYLDPSTLDPGQIEQLALRQPLFEYADGDQGCGQTPYLKLLSQLFGDRLMVANATGSSSIFGGALPTTPWAQNAEGRGPAWSNSLFEDNAEFGFGFRLALDQQRSEAVRLMQSLDTIPKDLKDQLLLSSQKSEKEIKEQRLRVDQLKELLSHMADSKASRLRHLADSLVSKSVWMIGGDGWAYDIGFGGIDHAVSTGKNFNILVLDNELYDNTGGQMSKSTPLGASVKFAHAGKKRKKKDLGQMLMTYGDVYVASVSLGADPAHTVKTFLEAESYEGPSVIIAYCHSQAHGIDMQRPAAAHKAVVNSGRWLLYRHDPRRIQAGLNPLQLDSDPPILKVEVSLKQEFRFNKMFSESKPNHESALAELQQDIYRRYHKYATLAGKSSRVVREEQFESLNLI